MSMILDAPFKECIGHNPYEIPLQAMQGEK